ncbi:MAG: tRNA 4-thiouridine(8) synthase ThiI [Clostridiales bacterium]|nr:tRNA 4-thiouridine(8) synthase ThiI [Clostridiales bacterium]
MYKLLLIRYGELGLKGKNKIQFINRLTRNIENALRPLAGTEVFHTWGRIWARLAEESQLEPALRRLSRVFGVYSVSPVLECERDMQSVKEAALRVLLDALTQGGSFKIESRRSDKTFPLLSPQISQEAASYVFEHLDGRYAADMHRPQRVIEIEIRREGAYVFGSVIAGAKGLPVGAGGKALLMLSGGIDSPVAGYLAMKRGVIVEALHFYSFPFTGEQSRQKVIDLCRVLAGWRGAPIRLHIIHFTEIQKAIRLNCPEEYGITLMRRMMFRIAQALAGKREALAVYTGECVGQVASQTLESISVINKAVSLPVLRPLIGMDKEEIMELARRIGTYDISIRPFEDCCTIFLPEFPKIRPSLKQTERFEQALDVDLLVGQALAQSEVLEIGE